MLIQLVKRHIHNLENNPRMVNYVLVGNCFLIAIFISMIFILNQEKISNYLDIRSGIGRLKEISEGYELELTRSQVTLKPNIKKLDNIIAIVKQEKENISNIIDDIDDEEYNKQIQKYLNILGKRLIIRDELMNRYDSLANLYQDYSMASLNAERATGNKLSLQLEMKHIMLNLEKSRLITQQQNRNSLFTKINKLRNQLIYHEPHIQEKVGLFVDQSEEIIKLLRYLDTVRSSMRSDGHDELLDDLKKITIEKIRIEELKFSGKLIVFLSISILLVIIQVTILTLFFISKRKTERLKREALETIEKSKEIAERSKQYALHAQRTQYKLLHNFCGDFDSIISSVSDIGQNLWIQSQQETSFDINIADSHKTSINILWLSINALERWLANYLEVYTAQDEWHAPHEETIEVSQLFDHNFSQIRFFIKNSDHLLSIRHENIPKELSLDQDYTLKLLMNMLYISLKWSENSWLKMNLRYDAKPDYSGDDSHNSVLTVSVTNGAPQEQYQRALNLFHSDNSALQNNQEDNAASEDRFLISSLYFMRQICDILKANLRFERNISDENMLSVSIPVNNPMLNLESSNTVVPLLMNKKVLVVSPFTPILRSLEAQLKEFGLSVTAITDRYSAIGHIIGSGENGEQAYDLYILDHHPPEIDALALSKIIRDNSHKNLVHILVMTTETHLPSLEKDKSLYDASFSKPVKPKQLKQKMEEFIEIQLYGVQDTIADNDDQETPKIYRFLAVMNEDLSSMLLQLILTKSNYEVDVVSSSSQIYDLIEQKYYDFVLVSNTITWATIENLSRDLRRHHTDNRDSVIILIYDDIKEAYRTKLSKSGFDDFIQLPLSRSSFINKIEEWDDPVQKRIIIANSGIAPNEAETTPSNTSESSDQEIKSTDEILDELQKERRI